MKKTDAQHVIRPYLSDRRFQHSIRVAELCEKLAIKHHYSQPEHAYLAGLFHDIAKDFPFEKYFQLAEKHNYVIKKFELQNPDLLHCPVGMLFVKHELHFKNKEVLKAIRWHTTGKADMTKLEQIVYLADKTEPKRHYKEREWLQELAYSDLSMAMYQTARLNLIRLLEKELMVSPASVKCFNHYYRITKGRTELTNRSKN